MIGNAEIGLHSTRPARSTGAPSFLPNAEAATPRAHKITAAFIRLSPMEINAGSICVTMVEVRTSHTQPLQLFQRAARKDLQDMPEAHAARLRQDGCGFAADRSSENPGRERAGKSRPEFRRVPLQSAQLLPPRNSAAWAVRPRRPRARQVRKPAKRGAGFQIASSTV